MRLREQLNEFRLKYDDMKAEMEQVKMKYRDAVNEKVKVELKYAKLKSYVVRQECEHEIRYKGLIKEIQSMKDLMQAKIISKRMTPLKGQ